MTLRERTASRLRFVSASAGSGKTYHLTREITGAIAPGACTGMAIEGLVGVTYTTKAHQELETRIRQALVKAGAFEAAQRLPLAYLGTVHAVSLRFVKEFALDAGLSPQVDVIPGDEERRMLLASIEHGTDAALHNRLNSLSYDLQFGWDARAGRNDWISSVHDLMTLARSNRIFPGELPGMAARSVEGVLSLMPPAAPCGAALERELQTAITTAIEQLGSLDDRTKKTRDCVDVLRSAAAELAAGQLPWATWLRLTKLDPSKRAAPFVARVRAAADNYEQHPAFRQALVQLTEHLFEAARLSLLAYAEWKAERGLLDYVDMIDRALEVLSVSDVASELRDRLKLVTVDEFQDTSPIQLALFTRLHELCGNSVWVGDNKQCIFEFAGADPTLMESVSGWVQANAGTREILSLNYRSRAELVRFTSTLFAAAFAEHGERPDEVVTRPHTQPDDAAAQLPVLGLWWLEGRSQTALCDALAEGVVRLLRNAEATPVIDKLSRIIRSLRASDVAVLVSTNVEAATLSRALQARGVATALARSGLLTTAEGTFVTAALRLLNDPKDTLAAADLEALTGYEGDYPSLCANDDRAPWERWLADRIAAQCSDSASPSAPAASAAAVALEGMRVELDVLSPSETVDRVLTVLDMSRRVLRWPGPTQRLANLDALRAQAAAYEEQCSYQREAASLSGLLRYFQEKQQEAPHRRTDHQHAGGHDEAVTICTYHKAKGLEWPVVVLGSLDRERKRTAFDVACETDRDRFDAKDPLGGRWIRFWPRPFGHSKSRFVERAAATTIGAAIARRDARERVRLLYVGCTRPRDHLILAVQLEKNGPAIAWLDELRDANGPLLTLPEPHASAPAIAVRGLEQSLIVPLRAWHVTAREPSSAEDYEDVAKSHVAQPWFAKSGADRAATPAYWVAPSRSAEALLNHPNSRVVSAVRFTRRMPFATPKGTTWDQIGQALHHFLAADDFELTEGERVELARRILCRAGLADHFDATDVLVASDALRQFVGLRWPEARWRREVPISAFLDTHDGRRRIAGSIDLLLDTPSGFVIIDHKSFPGRASEWEERALTYAPQLFTYGRAIEIAGGTVLGRFIHFTIGGGMVEVGEAV